MFTAPLIIKARTGINLNVSQWKISWTMENIVAGVLDKILSLCHFPKEWTWGVSFMERKIIPVCIKRYPAGSFIKEGLRQISKRPNTGGKGNWRACQGLGGMPRTTEVPYKASLGKAPLVQCSMLFPYTLVFPLHPWSLYSLHPCEDRFMISL
jgi:hypothetical protein